MPIRTGLISLMILALIGSPVIGQEPTITEDQPAVLTMEEAIGMAIQSSPVLATAVERVDRARNELRQARASSRFQVNANAQYARTGPSSTITFPGPGGEPVEIEVRPPAQTTANATLTQPIDISGRLSLARRLAGLNLNIQTFGEAQALQQLIADVKVAYYNVLRAQGNVDVTQASITAAEERLRIAQVQFDAGVAARFDVTQAEVSVANLQQTLIQAQNGVSVAKGALNRIIGIDVNFPYRVEEQEADVEPVVIDIEEETQEALEVRPEVQQAVTAVRLAEDNVRFTSAEYRPSLGLFVSTDWTSQTSAFSPNHTSYTYGASLNWPIWTSGVAQARVAQARNDVQIARETLETASLGVALDVRTSALNVMEASERVQTAQANVALAEESLRLANVRYREGVSTQLEVINAEASLTQALTNLVTARYDYLSALAQFQRATASQPEYDIYASSAAADLVSEGALNE